MTQKPILIINASNESKSAKSILNTNNITYTTVVVSNGDRKVPRLILNGSRYKGINGIKLYIKTQQDVVPVEV